MQKADRERPDDEDSREESDVSEVQSCKTFAGKYNKKLVDRDNSSNVIRSSSTKNQSEFIKNVTAAFDCSKESMVRANGKDITCIQQAETDPESRKNDEEKSSKTRKKKKRRYLTICTSNCKYEVIRRVASRFGMKEVTEDSSWNLYWTDLSISIERAKDMKRFQKVNHFPGMTEICRKDLLARNLNRMLRLFPKDYNFFPKTWCLPADHGEAIAYAKLRRAKTFIIKPDTGCQGRGIYLTKNLKDVKPYDRMICQVYIAKPFLIDGFKFDLRVYALITSCDPLRIYVYNDGLVRFATSRYKEPTGHNSSNVFMHLTNYAVNKHSRMYVVDDETGSKRKISTLNKWLRMKDVDVEDLWSRIDEIIIKTILAAYPVLKHSYHTCFPTHDATYACFELLGFDVLLDWKLKPYLLEVNHSPSFHTDAQIDKDVKESLLMDTFEMLNFQQCDKKKVIEEDRKRVRERLLQGINCKDTSQNDNSVGLSKFDRMEDDPIQRQYKWEDEHLGNFRRIYPGTKCDRYDSFFKQSGSSMFQETVASRAREEASKIQREETEMRVKELQDGKRVLGKWSDQRMRPESPGGSKRLSSASANHDRNKERTVLPRKNLQAATVRRTIVLSSSTNVLYSFEPEIICESEERERVTALAQRDFLIESYGIPELVYLALKRNGTVRSDEVRKYEICGKLRYISDPSLSMNVLKQRSQSSYQNVSSLRMQTKFAPLISNKHVDGSLKASKYQMANSERESESLDKCLKVVCTEAPVYAKPFIPQKLWSEELNSNEQDARITKGHVARMLFNTIRLHALEKRENPNFSHSKIK